MKRKTEIILLVITILLGSIITFFATNLLMSDLSNMFYGVHDAYIVASIPMFIIALDFVVAFLFIIRFYRYPQYKKAMVKLYTLFLIINSAIGFVFAILTGTSLAYGSLFTRYIFPGYGFIMLLVHLALCVLGVLLRVHYTKTLPEDTEKRKMKVRYIVYTALLGCMTYYAFNKFGAFLYSPIYVYWRTLNMTFTFYLSMLMPMSLIIHVIVYFNDGYKGKEKAGIVVTSCILGLSILLCGSVLILGSTYPQFISAVSPALPLERLATMPINSIFMLCIMILFGTYYLIYAIRSYKRAKKVEA